MENKLKGMQRLLLLILVITAASTCLAQDSLLSMLEDSATSGSIPVKGTFKGIHIVNAQTIESPGKNELNFIIMHRFGKLNDGSYNFFGLDNASIRLGLDYGITDRLSVGIGRSSFEKMFDGYLKYKLLRQSEGAKAVPVSISVLGSITNYTQKFADKPYLNAKYRTTYVVQALFARKVSSAVSLQVSPTWMHFNLVPTVNDNNDVFAAVFAGRAKFTKRMSVLAEYSLFPSSQLESMDVKNSLSLGMEIETGGHVFQLVFTNSQGMVEPQYIARTTGSWGKGDIYFGFNINRNFSFNKKKKEKEW